MVLRLLRGRPARWLWRSGHTRSHPEHGSQALPRRWYCGSPRESRPPPGLSFFLTRPLARRGPLLQGPLFFRPRAYAPHPHATRAGWPRRVPLHGPSGTSFPLTAGRFVRRVWIVALAIRGVPDGCRPAFQTASAGPRTRRTSASISANRKMRGKRNINKYESTNHEDTVWGRAVDSTFETCLSGKYLWYLCYPINFSERFRRKIPSAVDIRCWHLPSDFYA